MLLWQFDKWSLAVGSKANVAQTTAVSALSQNGYGRRSTCKKASYFIANAMSEAAMCLGSESLFPPDKTHIDVIGSVLFDPCAKHPHIALATHFGADVGGLVRDE